MTDAQRTRLTALTNRARGLKSSRDEAQSALAAWRAKFEALAALTHWAELDTGADIAAGAEVRYFGGTYRCTQAHTKSLLRAPTNGAYWEKIE